MKQKAGADRATTVDSGEQMEQAFIWNPLDLAGADAEMTAAWWKAAVTFPKEFNYWMKAD